MFGDRPDQTRQLAGDCGRNDGRGFSRPGELAIAPTQSFLHLPCGVADRLGQTLLPQQLLSADARREPITPGRLDQHAPRDAIPGFRDAALATCGAAGAFYARSGNAWTHEILVADSILALPDIAVSLPLAELYEGVVFEAEQGSLFEPHADIIVKGARDVQYGHKLNLTTGRSGLILDLVIEPGNPADSDRFLPMLKRHIAFYGAAPRQTAADGGFASRDNLAQAKALGVHDAAFHKKAGLRVMDMVKSNWVYRKLRNFRAGIESDISCLKRAYGLARCLWRGLDHFMAYVWSSAVAYNLALFARLTPT